MKPRITVLTLGVDDLDVAVSFYRDGLDPSPFTEWITACGLEDAAFTTMARELGRPLTVDDVRPAAGAALEEVFGVELEEIPADDGPGLWKQPIHAQLAR
jgi:catechol 2,3-dioxygenase-like lactoylglutathione lyase family enzyme